MGAKDDKSSLVKFVDEYGRIGSCAPHMHVSWDVTPLHQSLEAQRCPLLEHMDGTNPVITARVGR
jgi:hypothetical protein